MYIIDLHYTAPLEQIDAHMKAHMAWLNSHYKNNLFLASGRKVPRTGGIIIAQAASRSMVENALAEDPFVKFHLAQCTITEFQTSQMHAGFKALIQILEEKES